MMSLQGESHHDLRTEKELFDKRIRKKRMIVKILKMRSQGPDSNRSGNALQAFA